MVFCLIPLIVKLLAPPNTVQKEMIVVGHLQVLALKPVGPTET